MLMGFVLDLQLTAGSKQSYLEPFDFACQRTSENNPDKK